MNVVGEFWVHSSADCSICFIVFFHCWFGEFGRLTDLFVHCEL